MFLGSNQPRTQRSFAGYAPTLSNNETEAQGTSYKVVRVSPVEWKPEPYTKDLFDAMFAKWKPLSEKVPDLRSVEE